MCTPKEVTLELKHASKIFTTVVGKLDDDFHSNWLKISILIVAEVSTLFMGYRCTSELSCLEAFL